jgi:carbamoyltransferase
MTEPWILGIASSHNGGACLLQGNAIVVAVQEERLLRYKRAEHPGAFPSLAVQYCLSTAGIRASDLTAVGLCASETVHKPDEDVRTNPQFEDALSTLEIFPVPHHLGHAVAAYAMAGTETATALVIDGCGSLWQDLLADERAAVPHGQLVRAFDEHAADQLTAAAVSVPAASQPREVASIYSVEHGQFTALEKHISLESSSESVGMAPFASLGNMYAAVGLQIFGNFLDGPGKVMGLAPYGQPTIPIEEFYHLNDWGLAFQNGVICRFQHNERWPNRKREYQDLAASVQRALEEGVLRLCERLRRWCVRPSVCYSGGVALNSVANQRVIREAGFADLFIMPAAEDSGTAIGAAYYALWKTKGYASTSRQQIDSSGKRYSSVEICEAVQSSPGVLCSAPSDLVTTACDLLADGKIVGWFQVGSELGPRSLGQRSIFCDPRPAAMKEILNRRVKFREAFRPFAPVILEEDVQEWFDVDPCHCDSPFMLRVMHFWPEQAAKVPAVVHVDGTGRVQTVCRDYSPLLYALLSSWKQKSGIPILLNTSFNIAGEPIVETPDDAIWCMSYTGIDCCVLGDYLIKKIGNQDAWLEWKPAPAYKDFSLYDASSKENSQIEIPDLSTANENLVSVHIARAHQMAQRFQSDHLRIIVEKQWGEIAHGMSPAMVKLLELVDGRRSALAIFDILNASSKNGSSEPYTIERFKRHMGILRRAGAIRFSVARAAQNQAA